MDWTDKAQSTVVDRITPVPLSLRQQLRVGAFTPERHAAFFDDLPCLRQIETGGAAARRERTNGPARLVFWNVERLRHLDGIAASLAERRPDVMLLSEIDRGMARSGNGDRVVELADRLGVGYLYAIEFVELDLGDVHEQRTHAGEVNLDGFHGAATLSDVALSAPALIRLERRGNWFGTDRHEPRVGGTIALAAIVYVGGEPVLMVNVHLESHETPQSRADDMRHLLTIVEGLAPGGRAVIGGDFNTSTATPAERYGDPAAWAAVLAADPMRLVRPEPHEPLFAVAAAFGYDWKDCNVADAPTTRYPAGSPRPLAKIDWVFTRGLAVHEGRCCTTLAVEDSHCESIRLDGPDEQAITHPLPHDELVQLHCVAAQARVAADLAGQGDDLACAA